MSDLGDPVEGTLLGGRLRLLQPATGYRSAIDPVLLAAAVPARSGDRLLDLGCGVGTAMLCLVTRVPGVRVVGLELQEEFAVLTRRNAELNGLGDAAEIVRGDVAAPPASLAPGSFDHVMANPPYLEAARGRPSGTPSKTLATVEGEADLATWAALALRLASLKATVTFIHRADRLDDLLAALGKNLGGVRIVPLWPRRGEAAKRVIVQGRKGSRAPLEILPGLVLHGDGGAYTAETEAILRGGEGMGLEAPRPTSPRPSPP